MKASDVTPPNKDQLSFACANTCNAFSTPQRFIAWTTRGRSINCATPRLNWCGAARWISATSGPILFRSLDEEHPAFGVNPFPNPLACYIGAWDWGKYLGDEAIEQGVDVCVSTWNRLTPNSMPAMAKSGANYMNSQLIKMEALLNGFAEGIALDDRGYVSEGSGENIFLVTGDVVLTPPLSSSILPGITRDSVIQICQELGITVKERTIQRAALYVADELFFSGTAAEITPIRSVDRITVGSGGRGPITEKIQKLFFEITKGERPAPGDWLTYVNGQKGAGRQQWLHGHAARRTTAIRRRSCRSDCRSQLINYKNAQILNRVICG